MHYWYWCSNVQMASVHPPTAMSLCCGSYCGSMAIYPHWHCTFHCVWREQDTENVAEDNLKQKLLAHLATSQGCGTSESVADRIQLLQIPNYFIECSAKFSIRAFVC